jgi:hypothetical protein
MNQAEETGRGEVRAVALPDDSLVAAVPFHDHVDAFRVRVDPARFPNVDAFARAFGRRPPAWIRAALRARDAVVGLVGLKKASDAPVDDDGPLEIGAFVGIFRIIQRRENEILAGEDDLHLDFRVSLLYERAGDEAFVTVSTVVRFNNVLGRAYFLPVRPVHGLIVPAMIRSAIAAA